MYIHSDKLFMIRSYFCYFAVITMPHIPQIWQRREPRKHLLSTSSLAEAGSASSLSGGLLSSGAGDLSQDEDDWCIESDEDSDRYEDLSSDGNIT